MNRTFFARCFRSALARFFVTTSLPIILACTAVHAQEVTPTHTTLVLSNPGSVAAGTVETLSASVTFYGTYPISRGLITFYDGKAVLGTGQIITTTNSPVGPQGSAVLKTRLSLGAHSLTASYPGQHPLISGCTSAVQSLTVTGTYPLSLSLLGSGASPATLSATATVSGTRSGVSGPLTFNDASDATLQLGTASLGTPVVQSGFTPASNLIPPGYDGSNTAVAAGDFNHDGIADLVVVDPGMRYLTVLPGKGDGTFGTARQTDAGGQFYQVAVGDFNEDGILDVALISNLSIKILMGNGDGSFGAGSELDGYGDLSAIVVADFNGDGIADLAVTDAAHNGVVVLLGNNDGTFTPTASPVSTGVEPSWLAIGDLNGDGVPDMAVTNSSDNTVSELLGNGDGTFTLAATLPVGTAPSGVILGDFNGDGLPDMAVVNLGVSAESGYGLNVLIQQSNHTFVATGSYPSINGALGVMTADFNGDGILDLALAGYADDVILVLLGDGQGGFVASPTLSTNGTIPFSVVVADFNGDGIADLASADGDSVNVFDATISTTTTTSFPATVPGSGGPHSIVAEYFGAANFPSAISNAVVIGAALEKTSLALTAPAYAQPGQPFTLSALLSRSFVRVSSDDVLSTDGRSITFMSGTTSLGSAVMNGGVATLNVSLPAGTAKLTAVFAGDYNFAGSTSTPVTVVVGSPTEAALSLKGQYAFLIHGAQPYAANTPVDEAIVGSFTADGNGQIIAGMEDINSGTIANLGVTFTGRYTVAADGSGTATITNSLSQSLSFDFIISGLATNGTAAAADVVLEGGTFNGGGVMLQQNPAEFALADLQGGYAFALSGETCYASCTTTTTNTGAVSAYWRMLLSGSTTLSATATEQVGTTSYGGVALSGTLAAPDSKHGRSALTMNAVTTPANQPTDYIVYVVDSVHVLLLSTDTHNTTMLLSGEGQYQ